MIKRIPVSAVLILISVCLFAQDPAAKLPNLLPITPNAAHLIKVGMGDVNKATGAATAKFPLYELTCGNYKLPISLSYFSQGNKTEEQCTRAGFGWSLTAGGVVMRKVRDVADEFATRLPGPADLAAHSINNLDWFTIVKNTGNQTGGFDTEPDEYNFSFDGHNGTFFIDDNGIPAVLSHENLKIVITHIGSQIDDIKITTTDGITYWFGGTNYDRVLKETGPALKTAFYLYKVRLPSGPVITLTYNKVQTRSSTGCTESAVFHGDCNGGAGGIYSLSHNWSFQYTQNEVCILSGITACDNTTVTFETADMPDGSGDKRYSWMRVHNSFGKLIREFNFQYTNVTGFVNVYPTGPLTYTGGINGRFYLTNIDENYLADIDGTATLHYPIEYYGDVVNEDLQQIYAQDLYGFKNGKSNQSLLAPPATAYANSTSIPWADKNSNANASLTGMLHSITYPTKGKEEFFYEANTVATTEANTPDQRTFAREIFAGDQPRTHTDEFQFIHDQTVHFNVTNSPVTPGCFSHTKFLTITIKDGSTQIATNTMYDDDGPWDYYFYGEVGHTYSIQTFIFPGAILNCDHAQVSLFYDASVPGFHNVNRQVGGVRVRKISQTDQFNSRTEKYFYYTTLANRGPSTGVAPLEISEESQNRKWECGPMDANQSPGQIRPCGPCADVLVSSNGIFNLLKIQNSHIYYSTIIESEDSLLLNGGTEYTFYPPTTQVDQVLKRGAVMPHPVDITTPSMEGQVKSALVFDKDLNPKTLTENNYDYIISTHSPIRIVSVREMYSVEYHLSSPPVQDIYLEDHLNSFNVTENWFTPGWIRLHDTRVTQYDKLGHSFANTTTYQYGAANNILPTAIVTTDSKNQTLRTEKKYPTDFPTDPVPNAMIAANMIAPVITSTTLRSGAEIQKLHVIFANNGTAAGGIQPQTIQQKQTETGAFENKILFSSYDDLGNLTEVSKALDGKISYLWDYSQSLVTAEVKNASKDNIGYTSFEERSKGNFIFSGNTVTNPNAITGNKVYDLSTGHIQVPATLDESKKYILSYWSNNGSKDLGAATNTVVAGRSIDGWTYYEHMVTHHALDIIISGLGLIDELRLYPADAIMTTFTYEPQTGQTSQCDVNNRITYYEYDGLGRLVIVRNQDKNIVKKICYNYAGQEESCSGMYPNDEVSAPFIRNDCPSGGIGGSVNYVVPAGTYTASSPAAANLLAQNDAAANGQAYANSHGGCTNQFGNQSMNNNWTKNDCGPGYSGSLVYFMIPPNMFYASTQSAADLLAANYLNANGQAYANAHGTCSPYICGSGNCTAPDHLCINGVCVAGAKEVYEVHHVKINQVWQWECKFKYCFGNVYGPSVTEYHADNDPCTVNGTVCSF